MRDARAEVLCFRAPRRHVGKCRYIEPKDINRQHGVLYLDYFCPDKKRPVGSAKDIINRFKYGVPAKGGL